MGVGRQAAGLISVWGCEGRLGETISLFKEMN